MFNKFLRKRKGMFCNEPEYKCIPYSAFYKQRNHMPTYYNRYYRVSKYIDDDGYVVTYTRLGLLNDIQDCNKMLLSMHS